MQHTEFYQFRKPTKALDVVKVGDINYNSDLMDELIHSTQISLAPAYDETRTSADPYNTGDVVMKDALMYRCLDDGVYGAWDATKWERTTAGEEGAGGSSVEANPQGTPTDDLDTIGINGTIYNIAGSGGGGGNVYGAFVDTNRIIKASTSVASGTTDTYTATEDCAVHIVFVGSTNPSRAYIDGVEVETHYASQTAFVTHVLYIRRGQVFSLESGDNSTNYTVYGLTFGTQNIFTPQIYSTEERCVGVWKDNKPLYQKTIPFSNVSNSGTVSFRIADVDNIFLVSGKVSETSPLPYVHGSAPSNNVGGFFNISQADTGWSFRCGNDAPSTLSGWICVAYTKTTDTAGSGSYNTLGVPMVHYTTDEQVVGTWIDGKTIYQKSISFDNTSSANLSIDVTSLHIDKMIEMKVWNRNTGYQVNAYYDSNTDYINAYFDETGYVHIRRSGTAFAGTGYITIQYTKSSS